MKRDNFIEQATLVGELQLQEMYPIDDVKGRPLMKLNYHLIINKSLLLDRDSTDAY